MSAAGPFLVGIDLGTQSAKVAVHAATGSVVAEGRQPLRPLTTPHPGVVEHPEDDLWAALGAATRQAMSAFEDAGLDRRELRAAGLCGIRNCQALLDEDGLLVEPVQSWMDARASTRYEPGPEVRWVTSSSGYLTGRLTGEVRDSIAAFRGRWPVDLTAWRWSTDRDVLDAVGIPPDRLVKVVSPGAVVGTVTRDAAAHTGLPEGLPVVATANDKAVEALGCGFLDSGPDSEARRVLLSLGTYVAAMTPVEQPLEAATHSWTNFAAVPGRYLAESTGIRRGMWTASWVRALTGGATEEEMNAAAALVPAGSDGLLTVLDWLAPVQEPHRRGAFIGLDARHGSAHLYRSVLEAMAMTMRRHIEAMLAELGGRAEQTGRGALAGQAEPTEVGGWTLVLSGGGARSSMARQLFADVTARPVRCSEATGGAASAATRGAAISAAVACGVHASYAEAAAHLVPPGVTVEPDAERAEFYASLIEVHRMLPAQLDPVLRRLHQLT